MPFGLANILPFLEFGSGAFGILDQQRLDEEANKANEARYQQLLSEIGGAGQQGGLYGRVLPEITRLTGEARKSGDVERASLARQFSAARSGALGDLTRAGLGGTTAASSVGQGFAREQQSATDRLNEMLKEYNLNLGRLPLDYDVALTGQRTGVIERRQDVAGTSPWSALSQLFGAARPAPTVDQPRDTSVLGAGISAGGTAAGLTGAAAILSNPLTYATPFFFCDREMKDCRRPAGPVLARLQNLPIEEWRYIGETADHIGPMSQDFKQAFGLGDSDKEIAVVDAFGVCLKAIQELQERIETLEASS